MIYITPDAVTPAAYAELNAQPMVSWDNLLARGTITNATLPTGAPRQDAVDENTADFWQPTGADILEVTMAQAEAADCAFLAAHTLSGVTVRVEYEGTGRTNRLLRSQEFSNASWTKNATTVTTNATTAPDGTLTAEKLKTTAASAQQDVTQSFTGLAGITVATSVYVKAAERAVVQMWWSGGATGVSPAYANFDLSSGLTSGTVTGAMTMQDAGGGWFRCTAVTAVTGTLVDQAVGFGVIDNISQTRRPTITGNGVSGLFLWGAQLEASAAPTSYIATTSAAFASTWHVVGWATPTDNDPFLMVFPNVAAIKWRLSVSAACIIGVAWIGPRIVIPGGVVPGYTPIWAARQVNKWGGGTRKGHWLGQRVDMVTATLSPQFMPITYDFAATTLKQFRARYNEGRAFVFASAPGVFGEDCAYCWAEDGESLPAPIGAGAVYTDLSFNVTAYCEP